MIEVLLPILAQCLRIGITLKSQVMLNGIAPTLVEGEVNSIVYEEEV